MTDDEKAGMLRAAKLVFQMADDADAQSDREEDIDNSLWYECKAIALRNAAHHIKAAAGQAH